MCTYMVNTKCKSFKKADKVIKQAIIGSLIRLSERLESNQKEINTIFNNDSIVYDRITDEIFIFKARSNKIQLRIVYACKLLGSEYTIYLIDYSLKKENNKKYINELNKKYQAVQLKDIKFDKLRS